MNPSERLISSSVETPLARYLKDIERPDFTKDASQAHAVQNIQRLYDELIQHQSGGWFGRLFHSKSRIKGLYLWGGVGRGKTYLMDIFFNALPFENKLRTHFHRFMKHIHEELTRMKGTKNPLVHIAEKLAKENQVICFDEFFVSDIADAMILASLFTELFERGVVLMATSNIIPSNLYKGGLQRDRFLPAIALIEKNTEVINVDSGEDYRLRTLKHAHVFFHPLSEMTDQSLQKLFQSLLHQPAQVHEGEALCIEHRDLPCERFCQDVGWFDFAVLCDGPRSQNDYIVLAERFGTLIVSNVTCINQDQEDIARRFINFVDEIYDRRVKLILSSEVPVQGLYVGQKLKFEFERTLSRLQEMQSEEYLSQTHLAKITQ